VSAKHAKGREKKKDRKPIGRIMGGRIIGAKNVLVFIALA